MKTKIKDGIIYLEEGKLEIFTPQSYMNKCNSIQGDCVKVLGLVPYKFYKNVSDNKPSEVGILNSPSIINLYPLDINQNVKDTIWDSKYKDLNENDYTVLEFRAGCKFTDQYIIKSLDNVTIMTDLVLNGKLDNNIPYHLLATSWIKNMTMNDIDLSVPATTINMIFYELCRYKHDTSKQFASVIGKDPKTCPVSYVFTNIRNICASNSVFAALSFEDMNAMLDASLNMTSTGKEQSISPVEQIIKY